MAACCEMPDVIAEAMRRRGRYTPHRILRNNYIAEPRSSRGSCSKKPDRTCRAAGPKRMPRRKPGAPRGNRHALKTGLYSGEMKALRLQTRLTIARLKLATAQAKLLIAQRTQTSWLDF